ncbi:MAG: methylated-DNA--[protein]-cysteine S-methyltransferase [Longimicrobiales bacterium]
MRGRSKLVASVAEYKGNSVAAALFVTRIETPLGVMVAVATAKGLAMLEFEDGDRPDAQLARITRRIGGDAVSGTNAILARTADELTRYFAGELRHFTVPLHATGTPFQERVWAALCEIPYGETRSYSEQARSIDAPDAVRAVARANGDNRIAIIIPCHRVIGANGKLTGYGGGLWRKEYLLGIEQGGTLPLLPG